MGLGLSASTIKSWFQYRCERKTRYELMDRTERAAIPLVESQPDQPWAELGLEFERRVAAHLARETLVLAPTATEGGLSERQATAFLRNETNHSFAAQVNLRPEARPDLLSEAPGLMVRRTFADLVRCQRTEQGIPTFRVIDIKATRVATIFHKTQVAFYARMLQAVLRDLSAEGQVDLTGSIWRLPDDGDAQGDRWQEEDFNLAPYLRIVDEFCKQTLPAIAGKRVTAETDETAFHVYFKCEQCPYLPHCNRAVAVNVPVSVRDVSAVPGMTHEAKRTLHRVGIRSVEQLAQATELRRIDGAGWSLTRQADVLVERANALCANEVRRTSELHTFLMPPRVDVGIYLVVDHDPIDDTLVTIGYRKTAEGKVSEIIEVLPTADKADEVEALVRVFSRLIADLEEIDRANQRRGAGIYCHIFFYEPVEAIYLQNAVKRHLNDARIRDGLLHMVRLFPPDEVVPEPEFRGMHHLPATALRSVLERLYALPVSVSYDLRQVSEVLEANKLMATAYRPEGDFRRAFSSLLSIEVSRSLREQRRSNVTPADVARDVEARLATTSAIAEWLIAEHRRGVDAGEAPMLRLAKKPFRLQATFDPLKAADLDILRAFEILESRSGMLETLVRLAQPLTVRRDGGRCLAHMRLLRQSRRGRHVTLVFEVPAESRESELSSDTMGLILSDDDAEARLNPGRWRDVSCSVERAAEDMRQITVRMFAPTFDGPLFQEMYRRTGDQGRWCIDQIFVDLNAPKAEQFLSYLAQGPNNARP